MISPPVIAPACFGDQLQLTCTTTGTFLEWSFTLFYENGSSRSSKLAIQSFGENDQLSQFFVNSVSYTFRRISAAGILPLISGLAISPITRVLNGTQVNCEDKETRELSSTIVRITNG